MNDSLLTDLTEPERAAIMARARVRDYAADSVIFAEGDPAGDLYFIVSGEVAISIQKFATPQTLVTLGRGDYFGEMAILLDQPRSATATSRDATQLLAVSKDDFRALLAGDTALAATMERLLAQRVEERMLKENLQQAMGIGASALHIGIKGDPSLRESSFTRERYRSMLDAILPALPAMLEDLLLTTVVYECSIHFNSGEIRLRSVLDPFNDSVHVAEQLLHRDYLDRHFPRMVYAEKHAMIGRLYQAVARDAAYQPLPPPFKKLFGGFYAQWCPLPAERLHELLARLPLLRELENFYVRNFSLSTTRELVRIQFNCDGTHILSADCYDRFIDDNIVI